MNKKLLIGLIILVVLIATAGLGYFVLLKVEQNNVEKAVEEAFINLKSGENNAQKQEILDNIKRNTNDENNSVYSMDFVDLFSQLEYSIIENRAGFKEAEVVLDITNKDMKKILSNYLVKTMQLAFTNAFTQTYTEEQLSKELADYLRGQIESDEIESITTRITLSMEKLDGKWVMKEDNKNELINAILPGFMDTINGITESFNQNTGTLNF